MSRIIFFFFFFFISQCRQLTSQTLVDSITVTTVIVWDKMPSDVTAWPFDLLVCLSYMQLIKINLYKLHWQSVTGPHEFLL